MIIFTQYSRKLILLFWDNIVIIWKSAVNVIFTFLVDASIFCLSLLLKLLYFSCKMLVCCVQWWTLKKINVHFDILCCLTILSYFCIRKFSAIFSSSFVLPQFSPDLYSGTIIKHMFILATVYLKLSFMYLTYFSLFADISKNYL